MIILERMQMKSLNYWQQFTHTGKVDDYLTYVKNKYQGYEDIQKEVLKRTQHTI